LTGEANPEFKVSTLVIEVWSLPFYAITGSLLDSITIIVTCIVDRIDTGGIPIALPTHGTSSGIINLVLIYTLLGPLTVVTLFAGIIDPTVLRLIPALLCQFPPTLVTLFPPAFIHILKFPPTFIYVDLFPPALIHIPELPPTFIYVP
jgi:hypothetical protein